MITGNTAIINGLTGTGGTNEVVFSMIPSLYSTDRILIPVLNNVNLGA